jgi:acetyltransferase-like isoleucine patch superfamily enzyme
MIIYFKSFIKNIVRLCLPDNYNLIRAKRSGMTIGSDCRVYSYNFGSEPYLISIGDHVTISSNVQFVTHDGGAWVFREIEPEIEITAPIKIGNNVFIGLGVIILPGTTIEDDVVIGAGSVVKGHIAKKSVYAGIPAKRIAELADYRMRLTNIEMIQSMSPLKKRKFYMDKFKI